MTSFWSQFVFKPSAKRWEKRSDQQNQEQDLMFLICEEINQMWPNLQKCYFNAGEMIDICCWVEVWPIKLSLIYKCYFNKPFSNSVKNFYSITILFRRLNQSINVAVKLLYPRTLMESWVKGKSVTCNDSCGLWVNFSRNGTSLESGPIVTAPRLGQAEPEPEPGCCSGVRSLIQVKVFISSSKRGEKHFIMFLLNISIFLGSGGVGASGCFRPTWPSSGRPGRIGSFQHESFSSSLFQTNS